MENKVLITTFSNATRLEIIRAKLEDEGIPCYTADETNVSTHNLAEAVGGIKLYVDPENAERAWGIVKEGGYHLDVPVERNWLEKLVFGFAEGLSGQHDKVKKEPTKTEESVPNKRSDRSYVIPLIFVILVIVILLLIVQ